MSNGSGDGGSDDERRAEGGSSVPQVLSKDFLVGNGLGDENEVEVESGVGVTGVDEVRDVLVAHEEPPDVVDGSGEGVSLETGGRHGERGVELRKAGWLVASC